MNRNEFEQTLQKGEYLINPDGTNQYRERCSWGGFDKTVEGEDEDGNESGVIIGRLLNSQIEQTPKNPYSHRIKTYMRIEEYKGILEEGECLITPGGRNEDGFPCWCTGFDETVILIDDEGNEYEGATIGRLKKEQDVKDNE